MRYRGLIFDELQDFPHHFQDILRNSLFFLKHKLQDTISSPLKTSQHSNVESSLIHCSTSSSSTFSEQSDWTQSRLDESNTIGRVEKNALFPHIPTAAICASFVWEGVVPDNPNSG
ncbi:hypothetical protein AVEN_48142-1 [Araneus ventricosus]|uniref:Uncharacterized protein n=1 Tax=Araneus ventricosus TaxID=182803 RepID=A0A4Y2FAI0_ARAVE|nr:hypothetical protein AVEN_48142-1 [Araneus ventricosus]